MLNLGSSGRYKQYNVVSNLEKKRALEGFARLAEYEHFYLYGKVLNGQIIYKECFSKFDIDGAPKQSYSRGYGPQFFRKSRLKGTQDKEK